MLSIIVEKVYSHSRFALSRLAFLRFPAMSLLLATGSFGLSGLTDPVNLQLAKTMNSLTRDIKELSTGLRITSPADGPAEYVIATNMKTAIQSYDSVSEGIQNATSYLNVASGALSTFTNLLQRCRTLAVKAANSFVNSAQAQDLQNEINVITGEINSIVSSTNFNGSAVFATPAPTVYAPKIIQSSQYSVDGQDVTLSLPTAPTVGNLMVMVISNGNLDDSEDSPAPTTTPPAGWTQVFYSDNNADSGTSEYYKTVEGGDSGTYTVSFSTADYNTGIIVEVSGTNTTNPVDSYATNYSADGNHTGPTFVSTEDNELALAASTVKQPDGSETPTAAAGWTNVATASSSYDQSELQSYVAANAGTTIQTGLTSSSGRGYGYNSLVVIKPKITYSGNSSYVPDGIQAGQGALISPLLDSAFILGVGNLDITSITNAQSAMSSYDAALSAVVSQQASTGVSLLSLQTALSSNQFSSVETTAAQSAITDTNIGAASTNLQRHQLLKNFATSLLTNAYTNANEILTLFR